ncbi:MAG: hypothetical protein CHACPFDD_03240 [Phycisphaerae bacterium]|nr:hypothetical protein [Phycisphaerae bacterium]
MKTLPFEYAARNLLRSPTRLAAALLGSALVAGLVLASAAFVSGMNRSLRESGRRDNVVILGAGSEESVERSEITAAAGDLVAAGVPGLRQRLGVVYVSPEVHVAINVRVDPAARHTVQAMIRGVKPEAFLVYPQVRMLEGRAPVPGADEIIVGALAAARLGVAEEELGIGRKIWFDERAWTVCGRFSAPGTVMDAEIWLPLSDIMIANKRTTISCVVATLDAAEFADVDAFCKSRLDLELVAMRESQYYARLMSFYGPIRMMVWVTAVLVAAGGFFGGLNTSYAAFASRIRELAALQTLGFSRAAIVWSMVQESLLCGAAGALLATLLGMTLLDGLAVRFSLGAFGLNVDSGSLALALATGLGMAAIGALPPAWRCLSPPITAALRAG